MVIPIVATEIERPTSVGEKRKSAIRAINVAAGYPGDARAVRGVDFETFEGERVAVIGPNGAGKSTLFKAVVGLLPFASGAVSIFGEDCRTSHNMVGYVPQHNDIDWDFPVTVSDVVMMGRTRHVGWFRYPGKRDRDVVMHLLDHLSLSHLADRQINELSGGQKRRVFVARALAQETRVLLLDEPFTGVDADAQEEIMSALDILTEDKITIVLATHDIAKAAAHFDKILLLKGNMIAYGAPDEVLQPHTLSRAYGGAMRTFRAGEETLIIADEHGC